MTFNHTFSEVLPRLNTAPLGERPHLVLRATCTECGFEVVMRNIEAGNADAAKEAGIPGFWRPD